MAIFLLRRFFQAVLVVLVASMLIFIGVYAIGDPIALLVPPDATTQTREAVAQAMGLDQPIHVQYLTFLTNAIQGDLGVSFVFRESTLTVILERLPATLELASVAMLLACLIGIPLGAIAGITPGGRADRTLLIGSVLGLSLPTFWIGILLILFFSVELGFLPASGRGETVTVFGVALSFLTLDGLRHLVLPAVSLSLLPMAILGRLTRAGVIEALNLDFARFARAQGNSRNQIVSRYVLRYISIPLVTVFGIYFGTLIAFTVVTESVFSWPGMGKLIIESIGQLDRPIVIAYMMLSIVLFMGLNLIVDILYVLLDPRVRLK